MNRLLFSATVCLALSSLAHAGAPLSTSDNQVAGVKGWHLSGDKAASYEAKLDPTAKHSGKASASLSSKDKTTDGFGTLMQIVKADQYRGKRVKFSAWLKTKDVKDWTGLWLRVSNGNTFTAFDNMNSRKVTGTTDWTQYQVVLDVAQDSEDIAFGTLLVEGGTVWLDDTELTVVDKSVPLTSSMTKDLKKVTQAQLTNPGFDE